MGQSYAGFQGKKLIVKQRGAVAIETVFLLPIVIILLFAIVHYSMIFFATTLFDYAAKESIRSAMSQVDENCYFNVDGCSDSDTLTLVSPVILDSATQVIQGVTHGSGNSLGVLFGVTLPARNELISVSAIDGGGCCEVSITLDNYRNTPFLPLNVIDGLLPGDTSVFPDAITATAVLKLN